MEVPLPTLSRRSSATRAARRSAGFIKLKTLIWLAIGFAAYAGWCHFPAYMKHSQLQGSIQNVLDHAKNQAIADKTIVQKALTAADGLEIPIGADDISVRREKGSGERTIHVEFAMPIDVEFLGSTKTVIRQVAASRTFAVNEAELAQRERDREDELYERERRHRKNREGKLAFKSRLQDECKSNGALITTHVMVTHPSGETQMVDCGSLSRW